MSLCLNEQSVQCGNVLYRCENASRLNACIYKAITNKAILLALAPFPSDEPKGVQKIRDYGDLPLSLLSFNL